MTAVPFIFSQADCEFHVALSTAWAGIASPLRGFIFCVGIIRWVETRGNIPWPRRG
jgi:hypothetical protein